VAAGYVAVGGARRPADGAGAGDPASGDQAGDAQARASLTLTPAGEQAAGRLAAAREAGIDRLVADWQPDQAPELRRLIGRITTTLVATDTAPEHDTAGSPSPPADDTVRLGR
jgi:hypothetical protein